MAFLELINLRKEYQKGVVAVKDINLKIEKGEFLVLLGPSGCGKTTTMRMISGLENVTNGQILMEGKDITYLPPRKRNVSMIFQNYAVWPHMTVYENIAFALKLKKMPKEEIKKIVYEVAGMADITQYLDRYPSQLSGGQRQRVAVARAIAVKPKLFLMDEPLSNLDAKLRVSMRTDLKEIHNKTNATTIFVTHDQSEAMSLADRIVIMRDGEIEQIGTPNEVYHDSETMFVANFIGTPPTNFIDVVIDNTEEGIVAKHEQFSLVINGEISKKLEKYIGKKVVLGVRPENFVITDESNGLFSIKVDFVEPQGSHTIIVTKISGKVTKIVSTEIFDVRPGDKLHLSIAEGKYLFFDPETERRIK